MRKVNIFINPMDYYRKLSVNVKAGLWFLLCNFITKGIAALTTPIFTRLLSTEEYGKVSVFYSWQDILGFFITFALSSSVYQRGLIKYEDKQDDYTGIMLTLMSFTTIISFIIYWFFRSVLNKAIGLSTFSMVLIFVSCFNVTSIDFWYQRRRVLQQYLPFVVVTLLIAFVKPISSITAILLINKNKVMARIISDTAVTLVFGMPIFIVMMIKSKRYLDINIWKESLFFVLPLLPHYLSQRILSQSDRIMISSMIGDAQAGIYSLAYSVGMLLMLLNSAIDGTMGPWIYRNLRDKNYIRIKNIVQPLLLLFSLCVLTFSLAAPELVMIFASREYYEAIYIVPIIAISSYFIFLYLQFIYLEYFLGKTQLIALTTIVSAAINLMLNYIFIKKYGYVAASVTTLACYIIYAISHYIVMKYLCKRFLDIDNIYQAKLLLIISFTVVVLGILIIPLYEFTVIRRIIAVIFILITLCYSALILKQFGTEVRN